MPHHPAPGHPPPPSRPPSPWRSPSRHPGPVVAKEGLQARLDAPIGRTRRAAPTLLVGMTVTFPDGPVNHPVEGSPIYLELVGRDHSSIVAMGHEDAAHGHYTMRIEVPASGIQ